MIGDNYSKVVSRNYTQQSEVQDAGLPKSGFDLSYQPKDDYVLGRLHVLSYQHLMPNTKYRGLGSVSPTLNPIWTPIAPDMVQRVHNFYVPYFAVNRDFRDSMTLNERNGYNSTTTIGAFQPSIVVYHVWNQYMGFDVSKLWNSGSSLSDLKNGIFASQSAYDTAISSVGSNILAYTGVNAIYGYGAIMDLRTQLKSVMPAFSTLTDVAKMRTAYYLYCKTICDFFIGQGSLLESLGYPYVSHRNLKNICIDGASTALGTYNAPKFFMYLLYGAGSVIGKTSHVDPLMTDTALRCYHAVWIEFYRNVQIQKLSIPLDYHKWDDTLSLGTSTSSVWSAWHWFMIMKHICPWSEDMFTSAQLDDIMRRVYLPILNPDDDVIVNSGSSSTEDNTYIDGTRYMTLQAISYKDNEGVGSTCWLPIPSILNRSISKLSYDSSGANPVTGAFDLFSLKRAHMLERYLKRAHFFGNDEYRDVIKGQYGVDLSDLRLNRPHFLGGSTSVINLNQKVSSAGNIDASPDSSNTPSSDAFGQRVAVSDPSNMKIGTFTDFSEEWGMTLSLYSVIPQVQYDPLCIQNTQVYPSQYPVPVLCQDFESIIPSLALSRTSAFDGSGRDFGHAPSAFQYRSRVNEVHGKFLDEYSYYTSARFFGSEAGTVPTLNSNFLECRPNIQFFYDKILLNGQLWYVADIKFYVEAPLPAPVEVI